MSAFETVDVKYNHLMYMHFEIHIGFQLSLRIIDIYWNLPSVRQIKARSFVKNQTDPPSFVLKLSYYSLLPFYRVPRNLFSCVQK